MNFFDWTVIGGLSTSEEATGIDLHTTYTTYTDTFTVDKSKLTASFCPFVNIGLGKIGSDSNAATTVYIRNVVLKEVL